MLKIRGTSFKSLKIFGFLPPPNPVEWVTESELDPYYSVDTMVLQLEVNNVYNLRGFYLMAGTLPTGVVLTQNGILYGNLEDFTTTQSFTFTIRALDVEGNYDDRTFSITIGPYKSEVIWITEPALPNEYGIGHSVYVQLEAESRLV